MISPNRFISKKQKIKEAIVFMYDFVFTAKVF
jgi:hypothetical protein